MRYFRSMGADLVGMSTVPEVVAAAHLGIRVLGISCVTNMAAGILDQPITTEEVIETGERVKGQFAALLSGVIPRIDADLAAPAQSDPKKPLEAAKVAAGKAPRRGRR
jgi:purine-nucleoside phosphorylase